MKRNEWMRREISSWQSDGIIDEQLSRKLLDRYSEKEPRFSVGLILIGTFGALLIGLGIIALLAANWDCFGRGARAAIAIAPVIVCGILAIQASMKGRKTLIFWEPLGWFWCLAVGIAACLVAQTYNVGGSVPGLIMFVGLLTLPVVWLTRATGPMILWPILVIAWTIAAKVNQDCSTWSIALQSLFLWLVSLSSYIFFVRRCPPRAVLQTGHFFLGYIYAVGTGVIACCVGSDVISIEVGILIFWLSAALVGFLGYYFRLSFWPATAAIVATGTGLVTPFTKEIWPYILALVLAIGIITYGVRKIRLGYTNLGACLGLWLILVKFFESRLDFTIKGMLLIGSGVFLLVINIVFIRYRKRGQNNVQ